MLIKNILFQVLAHETSRCLEDPSFLEARGHSLILLLRIERLNIKSELELVNATLKLANSW